MKSASLLNGTSKIFYVLQKIHCVKGPPKIGKRFKYITDKIKMSQYEQDFIHLLENEYIQQLRYFLNKKRKILFICQKIHSQERYFPHRNKVNVKTVNIYISAILQIAPREQASGRS